MEKILGFEFPSERFYESREHLWAKIDAANHVILGIDQLGLQSLGDLAYVSLEPVGTRLTRGESFGTLEAAKMTTDVVSPVTGILIDRNEKVVRDPLLVNRAPYTKGWLVVIEPESWASESVGFVSGPAVAHWAALEVERYRNEGLID